MIDIFETSKRLLERLSKQQKDYWETEQVKWEREALAPDGSHYDEELMMESIREGDRQRLLKFQ